MARYGKGRGSKGKCDNKRPQRANKKRDENEEYRGNSMNDISWYARNPRLLQAAAMFPHPYRPGMEIPLTSVYSYEYPGIMAINWVPAFGVSTDTTSPISITAQEIYARVRAAYSGQLEADAPDYIMYLGALDSIFTYIGWLKRIYRAVSMYSPDNYLLPNAFLYACGFQSLSEIANLTQNKVRLWQGINELILKSRKFKCPANYDLFNRHYWMSDNVYADAPSPSAQLYMYNLQGVYKLTEMPISGDATNTAMGLQCVQLPTTYYATSTRKVTVEDLLAFGDSLITALHTWDDGYTISGYLSRAYEGVPSFAIAELEQGELITASYSEEVLSQIENTRPIMPSGADWRLSLFGAAPLGSHWVTQSVTTNAIVSQCVFGFKMWDSSANAINGVNGRWNLKPGFNIHKESADPADYVIASRMQPVITRMNYDKTNAVVTVESYPGTEVPLSMVIYHVADVNSGGTGKSAPTVLYMDSLNLTNVEMMDQLNSVLDLSHYDWHPFAFVQNEIMTLSKSMSIVGDIYLYTVVDNVALKNLHDVCLYSELNAFQA